MPSCIHTIVLSLYMQRFDSLYGIEPVLREDGAEESNAGNALSWSLCSSKQRFPACFARFCFYVCAVSLNRDYLVLVLRVFHTDRFCFGCCSIYLLCKRGF